MCFELEQIRNERLCSIPRCCKIRRERVWSVKYGSGHGPATRVKPSAKDKSHLQAAEGWLELGNHLEANEELEKITPELRAHPDVLEMRCRIYEAAKQWEMAASFQIRFASNSQNECLAGCIRLVAFITSVKRTKRIHLLVDVVELFPGNQTIRYDIAVYVAQRGLLEEAVEWLNLAFENDTDGAYRLKALNDPLLENVWNEIGRL